MARASERVKRRHHDSTEPAVRDFGEAPERCVVSTKAALAQMTILHLVALELGKRNGALSEARYSFAIRGIRSR